MRGIGAGLVFGGIMVNERRCRAPSRKLGDGVECVGGDAGGCWSSCGRTEVWGLPCKPERCCMNSSLGFDRFFWFNTS